MQITDSFDSGNLKIQAAYLTPGEQAPEGYFFDHFKKDGQEVWSKHLGPSDAMKALEIEFEATALRRLLDYDGALEDLREMYERGRKWIADNIAIPQVSREEFMAIYKHTLEVAFAMMAFREVATVAEQF